MAKKFKLIQGGLGSGGKAGNLPKRMSFTDSLLESVYLGLALNFNLPDRLSLWAAGKLGALHWKYGWPVGGDFIKVLTYDGEK